MCSRQKKQQVQGLQAGTTRSGDSKRQRAVVGNAPRKRGARCVSWTGGRKDFGFFSGWVEAMESSEQRRDMIWQVLTGSLRLIYEKRLQGVRSEAMRSVRRILQSSRREMLMAYTRVIQGRWGEMIYSGYILTREPIRFEVPGVKESGGWGVVNHDSEMFALSNWKDEAGINQDGEDCGRGRFGGEDGESVFGRVTCQIQ